MPVPATINITHATSGALSTKVIITQTPVTESWLLCRSPFFLNTSTPEDITVPYLGGGVLPYMGYIDMCSIKGYGFLAVLVINRVSNLVDSGHK